MKTATITLSVPNSPRSYTRTVTAKGQDYLASAIAAVIRSFADRYGVSPLAIDRAITLH